MPEDAATRSDPAAFRRLCKAPLHGLGPAEWEAYYPRMSVWLAHEDPEIRRSAVERLATAVFWAEPSDRRREAEGAAGASRAVARLRWLLGTIEAAAVAHPDVLAAFLGALRWQGDKAPFIDRLLDWLSGLAGRPGAPADVVGGTRLLLHGCRARTAGGADAAQRADWLARLDHPSDYVRACAARLLGGYLDEGFRDAADDAPPGWFDRDLLAQVVERDLARPGVLGPFLAAGEPDLGHLPFDPLPLMLDVMERRAGREPHDLPFNGLDFLLHEQAAGSAAAVRRMIDCGAADTALLTATEYDHPVPGMADLLAELGRHSDPRIFGSARAHLASVYNRLHPEADPHRLRRITGWRPNATLYALRQGGRGADGDPWRDVAILHPAGREAFSDAEAIDLVDALIPPALRGAPSRTLYARDGTGPCRSGNRETQAYASGVLVTLTGDPEARRWQRIRIIARGLQGRSTPFDLAGEDGRPQPDADGGDR
jgi:hypothetical protein